LFQVIVGRYGEKPELITEDDGKTRDLLSSFNRRHINITGQIHWYLNCIRDGDGCFISGAAVSRRFSQFCEKQLLISPCLSVLPSVIIEQLVSHWTEFYEISHLSIFESSVEKIQVRLKYEKNYGFFTLRPTYFYDNISLNSSWNEKYFIKKW
jgi:hypothetical protein